MSRAAVLLPTRTVHKDFLVRVVALLCLPKARSAVCEPCHKRWAFEEYSDEMPDRYYEDEPCDETSGWDLGKEELL